MTLFLDHTVMVTPRIVEVLFTEPLVFLAVWLLLGWLLLRPRRHHAATAEAGEYPQAVAEQRSRQLKLVLFGGALYVLYRVWHNR